MADEQGQLEIALWNETSKKGNQYLSGKVTITEPGEYWVSGFKNDTATPENRQPAMRILMRPKQAWGERSHTDITPKESDDKDDAVPF